MMSGRLLFQGLSLTSSKVLVPLQTHHHRPFHLSRSHQGMLDYFRKKTPEEVVAKEEAEQEAEAQLSLEETGPSLTEEEINAKRNKSRLNPYHQRLVNGEMPYTEPMFWTHNTREYKRRMYARYGESSGVNPGMLWPTATELKERIKYESVCNPFTIQEMVEKKKQMRAAEREAWEIREKEIIEKMAMLNKYKEELFKKQQAKENEQQRAKERREKLMEEVRRHFGYTVDHRDEKFQEMLAKKEKEQRKAMKEARKMEKQQRQLQKMEDKAAPENKPKKAVTAKPTDDDE